MENNLYDLFCELCRGMRKQKITDARNAEDHPCYQAACQMCQHTQPEKFLTKTGLLRKLGAPPDLGTAT